MKTIQLPPLELLRERYDYNPETGIVTRKVSRGGNRFGEPVGFPDEKGYLLVTIDCVVYKLHRICYYMGTGIDPNGLQIDHLDRNKQNNRLSNLCTATHSENCKNRGHYTRPTASKPVEIHYPDGGKITTRGRAAAAWILQLSLGALNQRYRRQKLYNAKPGDGIVLQDVTTP
jgi:hypothetical protein